MKQWQTSLRNAATTSAWHLDQERHYRRARQLTTRILATVEGERGPTPKALTRRANEYAREVLGSIRFAPWLHVYSAVSGHFAEGWIPSNYYGTVVSPLKNGVVGPLTDLKTMTRRILHTAALPDLAYVIDGAFYSAELTHVADEDLCALLFAHDDRVFFKEDDTDQGKGLAILHQGEVRPAELRRSVDGVFQAPIHQHDFFADLSPRSTATIRITTVKTPASAVEVRAAYLRVGRANDEFVKSASSFRIPLNQETGELAPFGYMHDWRRADAHPDTHATFAGRSIPCFAKAAALCLSWHASFPYLACIGWDVCVDRNQEIKLMEWNGRQNDIKFSEATSGPCFQGLGWENLWKSRTKLRSAA